MIGRIGGCPACGGGSRTRASTKPKKKIKPLKHIDLSRIQKYAKMCISYGRFMKALDRNQIIISDSLAKSLWFKYK